jgi:phage shock protein C
MQSPGSQSFYRGTDRIVGGVCSGLAEGFHVEALWVRLAFVVLALINGAGVVLYVVLWVLMPERSGYRAPGSTFFESMSQDVKRAWADLQSQFAGARPTSPSTASIPADPPAHAAATESTAASDPASALSSAPQTAARNPSFIFGAILILIGIVFLAANTKLVEWSVIWPAALVVLGIALLVRNLERRS